MKYFLLFVSFLPQLIYGQVIGDEALQKVQDGQVSFLEGEFIVFLEDTVSSDFIEEQFKQLGYEISYIDIQPILISIVNNPADSVLNQLQNHPEVLRSFSQSAPVDTSFFENLLEEQGLNGTEREQALIRLISSQSIEELFFEFEYTVNTMRLKEIMGEFRSVAYQILKDYPRSVNIACTPGEEAELMTKIEKLPFVLSTALIGVIEN